MAGEARWFYAMKQSRLVGEGGLFHEAASLWHLGTREPPKAISIQIKSAETRFNRVEVHLPVLCAVSRY